MTTSDDHLYSTTESRTDTVAGISYDKIVLWRCIRLSRKDFGKNHDHYDSDTKGFIKWLAEVWGIKICMAQDGYNLSHEFDIIAPDKYTMFMLKYG